MKKIISYIVVIALIGVVGFSIYKKNNPQGEIEKRLNNSNLYPLYQSLSVEDKEIYVDLCAAIETFDYRMDFGKFDTYKEASAKRDKVFEIYDILVYEQPQYFWIDPFGCRYNIAEEKSNELTFWPGTILGSVEVKEKKKVFDDKVSEIVSVAETKRNTYEKVLYVYDTIMANTSYDDELSQKIDDANENRFENYLSDNKSKDSSNIRQTAYGCLIEGKTVCSGYTLAFNLIMQELGYECGVVSNRNLLGAIGLNTGYHVSNYCKLDGDYYYFDLTWDDTGFDSDEYKKYMDYSHRFFAITRAEFEKTHLIYDDTYAPEATATKYDYFVKNNIYFEKYDYEAVKQSILLQGSNNFVVLKFSDYSEALKAESELITEQKIYSLIGKNECKYLMPEFSSLLYIFF